MSLRAMRRALADSLVHALTRNLAIDEAILFLASSSASWITGTVLPLDGGVMAGRQT